MRRRQIISLEPAGPAKSPTAQYVQLAPVLTQLVVLVADAQYFFCTNLVKAATINIFMITINQMCNVTAGFIVTNTCITGIISSGITCQSSQLY